jgi:hypothetical protein
MKIDLLKLTIQFETQLDKKWVGLEAEIDDAETPEHALTRLKDIIHSWVSTHSAHIDGVRPSGSGLYESVPPGPPPVIQIKPEDREIGIRPEDILSSPDLAVLGSYRLLIKGKPELERAYALRHDQLAGNK